MPASCIELKRAFPPEYRLRGGGAQERSNFWGHRNSVPVRLSYT